VCFFLSFFEQKHFGFISSAHPLKAISRHQPQVFAKLSPLEPNFGSPTHSPPPSLYHAHTHPLFFPLFPLRRKSTAKASSSSSSSSSSPTPQPQPLAPPALNPSAASTLLSLTGISQPPAPTPSKQQQQLQGSCTIPPPLPPCSSMSLFWADACNSTQSRPLQTLLDSTYASCGVTVRRAAVCVVRVARGW